MDAVKACPLGSHASSRPCVSLGRAFCAIPSTRCVKRMVLAHLRLLAGRTGSTASFLDCLAAALQDLPRRRMLPRALQMSRRGSRGAARLLCNGFCTGSGACRSLRGPWYLCFVCGLACRHTCGEERSDENSDHNDLVSSTM